MNSLYLKSFIRCKRKAWLDCKGDKSYEVWSAHKAINKVNQFQIFYKLCNGEIFTGSVVISGAVDTEAVQV